MNVDHFRLGHFCSVIPSREASQERKTWSWNNYNLVLQVLLQRWGNSGTKKLSHLPNVIYLVTAEAWVQTQVTWHLEPCVLGHYCIFHTPCKGYFKTQDLGVKWPELLLHLSHLLNLWPWASPSLSPNVLIKSNDNIKPIIQGCYENQIISVHLRSSAQTLLNIMCSTICTCVIKT